MRQRRSPNVSARGRATAPHGNSGIYTALRRLLADGALAERPPARRGQGQSSIVRSYALSPRGRAVARREIERLESVLHASRDVGLVSRRSVKDVE